MKEVIEPNLIIVFRKMITGMTGTFMQFNYEESFSNNKKIHEQLSFFPIDKVFKNEMGDYHGK